MVRHLVHSGNINPIRQSSTENLLQSCNAASLNDQEPVQLLDDLVASIESVIPDDDTIRNLNWLFLTNWHSPALAEASNTKTKQFVVMTWNIEIEGLKHRINSLIHFVSL